MAQVVRAYRAEVLNEAEAARRGTRSRVRQDDSLTTHDLCALLHESRPVVQQLLRSGDLSGVPETPPRRVEGVNQSAFGAWSATSTSPLGPGSAPTLPRRWQDRERPCT